VFCLEEDELLTIEAGGLPEQGSQDLYTVFVLARKSEEYCCYACG
jgi:hypothetical protein